MYFTPRVVKVLILMASILAIICFFGSAIANIAREAPCPQRIESFGYLLDCSQKECWLDELLYECTCSVGEYSVCLSTPSRYSIVLEMLLFLLAVFIACLGIGAAIYRLELYRV